MAHSSKEPLGRKNPSAKSLRELMELLMKLNAELREKISTRRKGDGAGVENTEMVIIILSNSPQSAPSAPRMEKPKPGKNNWIDGLCQAIERGSGRRKGSRLKD